MNQNRDYVQIFSDKNYLKRFADACGVKMPGTFLAVRNGLFFDGSDRPITATEFAGRLSDIGEAFVKPTKGTCSGVGCRRVDFHAGVDAVSGLSAEKLMGSYGLDYVVQEVIHCHRTFSTLHPQSVNTFRITTYRWHDSICIMPLVMRIGIGNMYLDNAHAGGVFIAVDMDGTLHDKAFTEFMSIYETHPDTGIVFDGYHVDGVDRMAEAARRLHTRIPEIGLINWDFTLDEQGEPILIEANVQDGGVWIAQMPHGVSVFGDRTEEILRWMRQMDAMTVDQRRNYQFGRMK